MKKLGLLTLALSLSIGLFAQGAKHKAKVVVVFMGEKNPTFDESLFPNCEFYYTPGITAIEKKVNTLSGKIAGNITGDDYSQTYDIELTGTPEAAYKTDILETVLFDKNGYISGLYKSFENIALSPKKNLQGSIDFANYNAVSKDYIKKGKETKKAKKAPKKPHHLFDYYGMEIPFDFDVENAAGEKKSIRSIVKGEPLTILHTLHISQNADFKVGLETGQNKTGKEYLKDQNNTSKSFSALRILFELEENIFGHKVVL